jgi:GNAT superfamily N-acetyltransferase
MDDTHLARLEHKNLVEALAALGRQVGGGMVERSGGVTVVATGLPVHLFNQVLIDGDDATAEALAAAVALMRKRQAPWVANLRVGADDAYMTVAKELGLVPTSADPWMPGMTLHPLPSIGSAVPVARHEIQRVTDSSGIDDHIAAAASGFGMPAEWLQLVMTESLIADPAVAVYVGYTDGTPVTAGLGFREGDTIGVFNVATIEAARGRGYGAAMTMRIVDDGAAAGCSVAALQASDMGKPIYERLGFRTVVEYMAYVEPVAAPGG